MTHISEESVSVSDSSAPLREVLYSLENIQCAQMKMASETDISVLYAAAPAPLAPKARQT